MKGKRTHDPNSSQVLDSLIPHRDVLCVHELHSKVVRLHQINVIHDLIKEILALGFTLQRRNTKKTRNLDCKTSGLSNHQFVYK